MQQIENFNWAAGSEADHLNVIRSAPQHALRELARRYDWRYYPETALGWVMAQKSIDLPTAISTFFNGGPERFNYLHKRDVPQEFQATARVLDNICLRVNSGFYLGTARADIDKRRLRKWLAAQHVDRKEGHCGRWVLDEDILNDLFATSNIEPVTDTANESVRSKGKLPGWIGRALHNRRRNAAI